MANRKDEADLRDKLERASKLQQGKQAGRYGIKINLIIYCIGQEKGMQRACSNQFVFKIDEKRSEWGSEEEMSKLKLDFYSLQSASQLANFSKKNFSCLVFHILPTSQQIYLFCLIADSSSIQGYLKKFTAILSYFFSFYFFIIIVL